MCLLKSWTIVTALHVLQAKDSWRDVRRRFTSRPAFKELAEAERRTIIRAFLTGLQVLTEHMPEITGHARATYLQIHTNHG